MNVPSEEDLVLYYYGEAERPREIAGALASSADLRARYEELCAVLDAVEEPPQPELPPSFGAATWARLRPSLEPSPSRWSWLRPSPRWAWAAALGTVLVVAFLAGRHWPTEAPARFAAADRERILLVSLADHLDRSQVLLMEIVNQQGSELEPSSEIERAAELVDLNRLFRQTAARSDHPAAVEVLDELERFLVELAHSAPDSDLEAITSRLRDRDLLFRVRVLGSNLRHAADSPHPTDSLGDAI